MAKKKPTQPAPFDQDEARRLLKDIRAFPEYCERFMKIVPEEGGKLIPLRLNPIQSWFHENFVVPTYEAGKPLRFCILKSRQMGFSTYISAFTHWCTKGHTGWNSVVIAQDDAQTRELFRMYRRFDQHSDDPDIFPLFPKRSDSTDAVEYNHPSQLHRGQLFSQLDGPLWLDSQSGRAAVMLDSRIAVKSSEKKQVLGRSSTFHTVHASEAAFWPDVVGSLTALTACAHEKPETAVFLETTANGMNSFHSFYNNLRVGSVDVPHVWQRLFLPWYWDPRYEVADIKKYTRREWQDEYEQALFYRILNDPHLTRIDPKAQQTERIWAKLFWRRWALVNKAFGDEEKFKQEYPSNDSEAFLFSGQSVFSYTGLQRMETELRAPDWQGNIELLKPEKDRDNLNVKPSIVQLEENPHGRLKIWEEPQEPHLYVIFGDVAEGKAAEGVGEEHSKYDFSAAAVLSVTTFPPALRLAAMWHGNCDPDQYGSVLVALAKHYRDAYLGWEINGPGRSLNIQVTDHLGYSNIYMREDWDDITKRITKKPGWRTTARTKPDMVSVAQRFIREHELVVPCSATHAELRSFSRVGPNKYAAATGHDDRVIAVCGALAIIEGHIMILKRRFDAEKKKLDAKLRGDIIDDIDAYREEDEQPWSQVLGSEF